MKPKTQRRTARGMAALTTAGLTASVLAACSLGGSSQPSSDSGRATEDSASGSAVKAGNGEVVQLLSHDSWAMDESVIDAFETQTGYRLEVLPSGDAGVLTNKLVLSEGNPLGDAAYGVDNTFASRAVDKGVFAPYSAATADSASQYTLSGEAGEVLTPIDWADVCVNVDLRWFADNGLPVPKTLDDLVDPAYRGLFVTPGAATSSPGFAFLLATIEQYGDGWQQYWQNLIDNGARITDGWTDAYTVDFSASGGDRPIVLSYNSSPPFTIPKGKERPTTAALLDTCYRQVEYVGVLHDAANVAGAEALIDFMSGPEFQAALPDNMYVFGVDAEAPLPKAWAKWAKPARSPYQTDPALIDQNRDTWIRTWSDIIS